MASSQQQRLHRLAQKKARRKALIAEKRKAESSSTADRLIERIRRAATAPLDRCFVTENLFEKGIGQVMVTRLLRSGHLACAFFLVDSFCLGVKDAFYRELTRDEFARAYEELSDIQKFTSIAPEKARALINQAVAYARAIGFSPAGDFAIVEQIFGGVQAMSDNQEFVFGKDGKPLYIAGPSHTPARASRIIRTLSNKLGPDGFHFIAPLSAVEYRKFPNRREPDHVLA